MIKTNETRYEENPERKEIRKNSENKNITSYSRCTYNKIVYHKIFEKILSKVLSLGKKPKKFQNGINIMKKLSSYHI